LKEVEDQIENVTAEDVLELSHDIFQNESVSVTLLGPVDEKGLYEGILSL